MTFDELDRIAARQFGLVSIAQLGDLGLSRRQIDWRISRGALIRVRYRVYRIAGSPVRWEQSVLSAVLAARASAVVSHQTAAALWQLHHSDRNSAGIHIIAARRVNIEGVTCDVASVPAEQ